MKILVINGPNINMLGIREPDIYGKETFSSLEKKIKAHCAAKGVKVRLLQSNYEGKIVTEIQKAYKNPGAYTHTSVAILDALKAVSIPTVEVHISNVDAREEFRKTSYVRLACFATISGHGTDGYTEAVDLIIKRANGEK